MLRLDSIKLEMIILEWVLGWHLLIENAVKIRLKWFGHVERKYVYFVIKRIDQMENSHTKIEIDKNLKKL